MSEHRRSDHKTWGISTCLLNAVKAGPIFQSPNPQMLLALIQNAVICKENQSKSSRLFVKYSFQEKGIVTVLLCITILIFLHVLLAIHEIQAMIESKYKAYIEADQVQQQEQSLILPKPEDDR